MLIIFTIFIESLVLFIIGISILILGIFIAKNSWIRNASEYQKWFNESMYNINMYFGNSVFLWSHRFTSIIMIPLGIIFIIMGIDLPPIN